MTYPSALPRTFPVAPLLALIAEQPEQRGTTRAGAHRLAGALGLTVRHASRYCHDGALPAHLADRGASRLGLHPLNVWPEEWADHLDLPRTPTKEKHAR